MGEGDVESQVGGTQESGESTWLGGGDVESQVGRELDGVDQGSPRVAEYVRDCMLWVNDRGFTERSSKVVCLWVFIEWRRPRVSLTEWGLLGCMELMAIMGALKTMLCDQCHVTPYGKLHGQT